MRLTVLMVAVGIAQAISPVRADVVELRSGGQAEGAVKRVEQERAPFVVVTIDDNVRVAIPEAQISRVADAKNLAEYRKLVAKTEQAAEAQYELAIWCKKNQLLPQHKFHLHQAIAEDPDHSKARAALAYVSHEGKWIRHAELQAQRGMISVSGKYRLPEEVALLDAQSESNVDAKRWNREVSRLRTAVLRGGEKGQEASAELAAIKDPTAAYAMARELIDSGARQPQSLRLFWIERLASFSSRPALEALVRTGIDDADYVVREKALEALQKTSPETAIANYLPMLKSNDNGLVRRAAIALTYFPNPEFAMSLVDALVTQHQREIPAGQGMNVGFGSDGSGGLSSGGKAQVITDQVNNPQVLSLLRQIEPDADFGYDQNRWRQYYAKRLSNYSGNMRRDQ